MKHFLYPILFFCACSIAKAQKLSPAVVASGGLYAEKGAYSLSVTLGEIATLTFSDKYLWSQGFQQPLLPNTTRITDLENSIGKILIFPNPLYDVLQLQLQKIPDASLDGHIVNGLGETIRSFKTDQTSKYSLQLADLPPGLYVLYLSNDQGKSFSGKFLKL